MSRKASELLELVSTHSQYFINGGKRIYLCYVASDLERIGEITKNEMHVLGDTIYNCMDSQSPDCSQTVFLWTLLIKLGLVDKEENRYGENGVAQTAKFWQNAVIKLQNEGI